MHQVLEEYNKYDVIPFVEALDKTRQLYYLDKIDILKDAVSISGVSMTYVLNRSTKTEKSIELYGPGGLCDKCRTKDADCKACDCPGSVGSGEFCTDCLADKKRQIVCH